jgi:hypothetical protein
MTKRSLSGWCGSRGSKRISAKKVAATGSAAEQQLVGWLLPASEVDLSESIRNRVAMFLSAGIREDRSSAIDIVKFRSQIADCRFRCEIGDSISD